LKKLGFCGILSWENIMAQTMKNDICEQVVDHWKETGQILPGLAALDRGKVQEVIDGINVGETELIDALKGRRLRCS
jgi:hypothetical protein